MVVDKSRNNDKNMIDIVSGLPRSGTSMMMRILSNQNRVLLTDEFRSADMDNPHGYFEYEAVKLSLKDTSWLSQAVGKTVKIISTYLMALPNDYFYRIIFMERSLAEIIASQEAMLKRRNKTLKDTHHITLIKIFEKHLLEIFKWLNDQENMLFCRIDYNDIINNPCAYTKVLSRFLGCSFDESKLLESVDTSLYRNMQSNIGV